MKKRRLISSQELKGRVWSGDAQFGFHGTTVSKIAAGKTLGAAPKAKVHFLDGRTVADRIDNFRTALILSQDMRGLGVVNCSWSADFATENDNVRIIKEAITRIVDAGYAVVASSGNDGVIIEISRIMHDWY